MTDTVTPTIAALLAGICGLLVLHASHYNATVDDAFITFRYSNNLLAGDGPRWNPGEYPVEGYTSLTWMLLMTVAAMFQQPQTLLANVFGIVAGIAGLIVTWQLARRIVRNEFLALVAPLLLAADRTYAGWCTGGLETALFTTLVVLGFSRWREEVSDRSRTPLAGIVFAVATLTRPEGAMFFVVAVAWTIVRSARGRLPWRVVVLHALSFVAIVGAHVAWRYSYYGLPLPNTFYCKVNGLYWTSGLAYLLLFVRDHALVPIVFFGGLAGWLWAWLARDERVDAAAPVALGFVAAQLAYVLYIGGDIYEFRFMDVVMPLVAIGSVVAIDRVGRRASRVRNRLVLQGIAIAIALVGTGGRTLLALHDAASELEIDRPIAMHVERLEAQDHPQPEYLAIGRWLARMKRPGDSLAIDAAGVIPYYSGLPTIDLYGLNDAFVASRDVRRRSWPGHEKRAPPWYVRLRAPTFLVPSIGDAISTEGCPHIKVLRFGAREVCVRIAEDLYFTFGTFNNPTQLIEDLEQRGADVVTP